MTLLNGKVAIVTGSGAGIGRATALALAREGARVLVTDINNEGGEETVRMGSAHPGDLAYASADVSDPASVERMVQGAVDRWGALHVLVNNAGISGDSGLTADYALEAWDKVIAINLSGVFYGMKYAIPHMLRAGGGAIVNLASILGQVGFAGAPAYVAAKHGVVGLTRNAALEYSAQGVRVNAVGPAFIDTAMIKALEGEMREGLVAAHPIGRLGTPEDVAELIVFLASDRASFLTGTYYAADGGYLAR